MSGFSQEDADYYYIDSVRSRVLLKDSDPDITLTLREEVITGHVRPSRDGSRQGIIDELLHLHRGLGMKIVFSKSLGISRTVSYTITL